MADSPREALALQREIAERRLDLATSLERLRGSIQHRIAAGRHLRDQVVTVALIGGALLSLFWIGSLTFGAMRRSRRSNGFFSRS
jgi:hypothetical protein